jgi:hypothetical protein
MNLSVLRRSWPRFDAPAQEGFVARPAAIHGAHDIGKPEVTQRSVLMLLS